MTDKGRSRGDGSSVWGRGTRRFVLRLIGATAVVSVLGHPGMTVAGDWVSKTSRQAGQETGDSAVEQVSYTVEKAAAQPASSKLKWSPRRPSGRTESQTAVVDSSVKQVAHSEVRSRTVIQAAGASPFNDPFGDRAVSGANSQVAQTPGQPEILDEQVLQGTPKLNAPVLSADPLLLETLPLDTIRQFDADDGPTFEESLAVGPTVGDEVCPPLSNMKSIAEIDCSVTPKAGTFPQECPLPSTQFQPRAWAPTTFAWKASGLCHRPAYFEDVHLERYGHSWGPYVQPLVSGAHFFLTVPVLPYKMGLYPPNECIYTLGYYRPGNCAPYMLDPLPISLRAGLAQAGAVVGVAAFLP